jgi:hypothetical protein
VTEHTVGCSCGCSSPSFFGSGICVITSFFVAFQPGMHAGLAPTCRHSKVVC